MSKLEKQIIVNFAQLQDAIKFFNENGLSADQIKEEWDKQFNDGFNAAIDMVMNQLDQYESSELATMNCWVLIEQIKEDLLENVALYKADG